MAHIEKRNRGGRTSWRARYRAPDGSRALAQLRQEERRRAVARRGPRRPRARHLRRSCRRQEEVRRVRARVAGDARAPAVDRGAGRVAFAPPRAATLRRPSPRIDPALGDPGVRQGALDEDAAVDGRGRVPAPRVDLQVSRRRSDHRRQPMRSHLAAEDRAQARHAARDRARCSRSPTRCPSDTERSLSSPPEQASGRARRSGSPCRTSTSSAGGSTSCSSSCSSRTVRRSSRRRRPTRASGAIPLPQSVADALARHLERFPPNDNQLVFTNERGEPISRTRFSDPWRKAVKASNAPQGTGFHSLRHYYASPAHPARRIGEGRPGPARPRVRRRDPRHVLAPLAGQ